MEIITIGEQSSIVDELKKLKSKENSNALDLSRVGFRILETNFSDTSEHDWNVSKVCEEAFYKNHKVFLQYLLFHQLYETL